MMKKRGEKNSLQEGIPESLTAYPVDPEPATRLCFQINWSPTSHSLCPESGGNKKVII